MDTGNFVPRAAHVSPLGCGVRKTENLQSLVTLEKNSGRSRNFIGDETHFQTMDCCNLKAQGSVSIHFSLAQLFSATFHDRGPSEMPQRRSCVQGKVTFCVCECE
jgi:hypothetical protein